MWAVPSPMRSAKLELIDVHFQASIIDRNSVIYIYIYI